MKYFKNQKRTFKREVAVALLVWLVYIVETKDVQIIEVLAWPIFSYVGAAFGFDSWGKQIVGKTLPKVQDEQTLK